MKPLRSIFLSLLVFSLGFSACENEQVGAANGDIQLTDCNIPEGLIEYKKFKNQESTIKEIDYEYNGTKTSFYHNGLLDVPTGYLGACNFPEDSVNNFKQDRLKIRFSGTVYVPKNVDLMNLNAVPVKLTNLEKVP